MARKEKALTADEVKRNAILDALIQADTLTAAADLAGAYRDIEAQIIENTIKDTGGPLKWDHASPV